MRAGEGVLNQQLRALRLSNASLELTTGPSSYCGSSSASHQCSIGGSA
jgi:hypothetical protein